MADSPAEPEAETKQAPMIPFVGHQKTTTWLLNNCQIVNQRIWDSHYEVGLYHLFDQSFRADSKFHMPFLPKHTREFIRSNRFLHIPHFGEAPFLLHCPMQAAEEADIRNKMQALFNAQLSAKGEITDEFYQFCIRQIAVSIKGRTGMDVARMWQEYGKNGLKFQEDTNVLVAESCQTIDSFPQFLSNEYVSSCSDETKMCLNGDFLCCSDKKHLAIFNIKDGKNQYYDAYNISHIRPISTGGFVFASNDGTIGTVKEIGNFTPLLSSNQLISQLKTSSGLQTTFAAVDTTRKSLIYGTPTKITTINQDKPIACFDIFNQHIFASYDHTSEECSDVTMYFCDKSVFQWKTDQLVTKMQWIPELEQLGYITNNSFSIIDPRCSLQNLVISKLDNPKNFSISTNHNTICFENTSSLTFFDPRMNSQTTTVHFPFPDIQYKTQWLKNREELAFITNCGAYLLISPELENPVIESKQISLGNPTDIQTSFNEIMVRDELSAHFISTSNREIFIPSHL